MPSDSALSMRLLLAGRSRKKHKAAAALGCRLNAVMTMSQLRDTDLGLYERVVGVADDALSAEWIRAAGMLAELAPIDALGVFSEPLEEIGVQIGEALGLSHLPLQQLRVARDKCLMRMVLRDAGIEDVASQILEEPLVDSIRVFLATQAGAIIVKPYDGVSSRAVSRIQSAEEIPAALAWIEASGVDGQMVAESFLEGPEFSVETISHEGCHYVVAITEKLKDTDHFVELGHTVPASLPQAKSAAIVAHVTRMLEALGHQSGPSHIEVILTGQGPRIVELHFRIGGDDIDLLCQQTTGLDMNQIWVEQVLGCFDPAPLDTIGHNGVAGIRFASSPIAGELKEVEGLALARAVPGVVAVKQLIKTGEDVTGLKDSNSRLLSVLAHAQDRVELERILEEAMDKIAIDVAKK